uniref:F-box domain-containing protein n=1 Tax=Bracon brevicornis TaxID=1563983 RepID=A0A6V7MF52_9HYME
MVNKRQPLSLRELAMGRVCQQLESTSQQLQHLAAKTSIDATLRYTQHTLRPYWAYALPAVLRTEIMERTIGKLAQTHMNCGQLVSGPITLYILNLCLAPDIKTLKISLCCYYGCSNQSLLFKCLLVEGAGLEKLELVRSSLLRYEARLFRAAIGTMNNLKSLTLRNIANDTILDIVGTACRRLTYLDISSSKAVTDKGVQKMLFGIEIRAGMERQTESTWSKMKGLLKRIRKKQKYIELRDERKDLILDYIENTNPVCETLRVINIHQTSITPAGALNILIHAQHIESLGGYALMGRVAEIIHKRIVILRQPFNLKHLKCNKLTMGRAMLISQLCPKLEKLHISEPIEVPLDTNLFTQLTYLRLENIACDEGWTNKFYDYISANGKRLLHVSLHCEGVAHEFDLRLIFKYCPNLRTFSRVGHIGTVVWNDEADGTMPMLKDLDSIRLGESITRKAIINLMRHAPSLRVCHLGECGGFDESDLTTLLQGQNALTNTIECFYLYSGVCINACHTMNMFNMCQKLKRIGNPSGWGLAQKDVELLNDFMKKRNIKVYFGDDRHWYDRKCMS